MACDIFTKTKGHMDTLIVNRESLLMEIADIYVKEGLIKGNFDAIPFHDDIQFRDPLSPGSISVKDKDHARELWWNYLPDVVEKCELLNSEVHENLSEIAIDFKCYLYHPKVKIRIKDRFQIDNEGRIIAQQNLIYGKTPNLQ